MTFVWSNNPNDVGPSALGYTASAVFGASTAANGYLWANSDRGLANAPGFDHGTHLTTTAIDCSGQPSVQLTFESLIGVFDYDANTNVKVRVSTDGQQSWTDFIPFPCLVTGTPLPPCARWSANPQGCVVNISSVAAGQAEVFIQFEWIGGWEYFWAIDDLKLSTVPDYDRVLDFSVLSHSGYGNEFACIPRPQLGSTFILGGQVRNTGLNTQTNAVLHTEVTGPGGGVVFSAETTMGTNGDGIIETADTSYVEEAVTLPGDLEEGIYTALTWYTSDQDANEVETSNDTVERAFKLDDLLYALDGIGVHLGTPSTSAITTNSFIDSQDGVMAFTYYAISASTDVYGLEVLLSSNTVAGAMVRGSIHDSTLVVADEDVFSPLAQGTDYVVTQEDVDNGFVTLVFNEALSMDPGAYYAGFEMNSFDSTYTVGVVDDATVPQPGMASCINLQTVDPPGTYSNGNALAIRMILDQTIGMDDSEELSGVSMFPNPTNGLVNLIIDVPGRYQVDLTNLLGENVAMHQFTGRTTMDLSGLAKGTYSVRITNGERTTVKRVTLN